MSSFNPSTHVGAHNRDFGAVSQMGFISQFSFICEEGYLRKVKENFLAQDPL